MKKTPRFLICKNPLVNHENLFILCTRTPKVLFEVVMGDYSKFSLIIQDIYEGSESEVEAARNQASKWFIAYLEAGQPDITPSSNSGN